MNIINHYKTPNLDLAFCRDREYHSDKSTRGGIGSKNYRINRIKYFKEIPDYIEVLIEYVDTVAIRTMSIPTEIIYESIYRYLPELFDE